MKTEGWMKGTMKRKGRKVRIREKEKGKGWECRREVLMWVKEGGMQHLE